MTIKIEKVNTKKGSDIFIIDYAGTITLDKGLSNMDLIENKIRKLSLNRDCIRLIFDIRNTIWENMETHNKLSKISRKIFHPDNFDLRIYAAILNNEITGLTFDNEHWFVKIEEAIKWLEQKI